MGRLSRVFNQAKENPPVQEESKKSRSHEFVNLNFKVDAEMRRRIKEYVARHDLSLKEVFEAAIEFYFQHHP